MQDADIFLLGDADELVSRPAISALKNCEPLPDIFDANGAPDRSKCAVGRVNLIQYLYYFDCYQSEFHWHP
jgi:hypothetical protein